MGRRGKRVLVKEDNRIGLGRCLIFAQCVISLCVTVNGEKTGVEIRGARF